MPTATGDIAQGMRTMLRSTLRPGKAAFSTSAIAMPRTRPPTTVTMANQAVRASAHRKSGCGRISV